MVLQSATLVCFITFGRFLFLQRMRHHRLMYFLFCVFWFSCLLDFWFRLFSFRNNSLKNELSCCLHCENFVPVSVSLINYRKKIKNDRSFVERVTQFVVRRDVRQSSDFTCGNYYSNGKRETANGRQI